MDLTYRGIRAHVNYVMEDQREGKSVLLLQKNNFIHWYFHLVFY